MLGLKITSKESGKKVVNGLELGVLDLKFQAVDFFIFVAGFAELEGFTLLIILSRETVSNKSPLCKKNFLL